MNETPNTPPAYARDLRGYGRDVPHARWPGQARIAVQFVLNYEEGGENNPLHGDPTSETFLSELVTAQAYENRHMTMESMYEYGSRAGVWRITLALGNVVAPVVVNAAGAWGDAVAALAAVAPAGPPPTTTTSKSVLPFLVPDSETDPVL